MSIARFMYSSLFCSASNSEKVHPPSLQLFYCVYPCTIFRKYCRVLCYVSRTAQWRCLAALPPSGVGNRTFLNLRGYTFFYSKIQQQRYPPILSPNLSAYCKRHNNKLNMVRKSISDCIYLHMGRQSIIILYHYTQHTTQQISSSLLSSWYWA